MQQHDSISMAGMVFGRALSPPKLVNELFPSVRRSLSVLGVLLAFPVWLQAQATFAPEEAMLQASNGALADEFGRAVAISGQTALVGAHRSDLVNVNGGAAYLYDYDSEADSWQEAAQLTAEDGGLYDEFGGAVALEGQRAVVGAPNHNGTGAIYVFEFRDTLWVQTAKLTASDAASGDKFGNDVAISGDRILVAAKGDDAIYGYDQGAAYSFALDTLGNWVEEAKLFPQASGIIFEFGTSLDLADDRAIIGCSYDNTNGIQTSSAYIFQLGEEGWVQEARFVGTQTRLGDLFGASVAIDGDWAVVGASLNDLEARDAGSAYVYHLQADSNWVEATRLAAADAGARSFFGTSVDISGGTIAIGSNGLDRPNATDAGGVYLFSYAATGWEQNEQLTIEAGAASDQFGSSVAINGNALIAGATGVDALGSNSGAAYAYLKPEGLEIDLGDDLQVFLGYQPAACVELSAQNVPLGSTYLWSTGETTASIQVCPTENTSYELTIVDPEGNLASDEVQVCVVDIRCGVNQTRTPNVTICMESFVTPGQFNTLCVPTNFVPTYLALGATLGDCELLPCVTIDSEEEAERRGRMIPDVVLDATPNPVVEDVTFFFRLPEATNATLELYDLSGKRITTLFDGYMDGSLQEQRWNATNMIPGVYIYKLQTEREVLTRKLVLSRQ